MSRSRAARGFAATTVIVILLMLVVFGTVMVVTSSTQQAGSALDLQSAKAYQAARAGVEFGIYRALQAGSCAASTTIAHTGNLAGFSVTVTCTSTLHNEAGTDVTLYQITSSGCNQPDPNCPVAGAPGAFYVERQLRVTAGSN